MTKRKKITLAVLGIPLLGVFALLLTLYPKFAEDVPWMRPFGWFDLPETQPYVEGEVAPDYRIAADRAQQILRDHVQEINVPAFSAAIAVDGKLVWSAATGYADLKQNLKTTPNTLFRIGSTSKAVTGTLLARMVDDSLVNIDAPISTYIDDLPNPDWAQLTPRQLASHTAGIVGYEENRDLIGVYATMRLHKRDDDVAEGLEYFDDTELLYEPGTDFHYSSFDVNLLSVVLQEAGGAPFQKLMYKQVLEPLGLDSPIPDAPHPDRAVFYHIQDGRAQQWREVDLSMKLAGGGFMATPGDLAKLGAAWLNDDFISPETRRQFWTPQKLADGSVNEQNYALNWRVTEATESFPFTYMHHGGVSKGSMAWLAVIPEERMTVALAINTRVWPFSRWSGVFTELVQIFADSTSVLSQNPDSTNQKLPDLKIQKLNDSVYIHTSFQRFDGFGLVASNGLVFLNGKDAYIIDTPTSSGDTKTLVDWFQERGYNIKGSISTHFHDDSALGIAWLNSNGIPTYAYNLTNDLLNKSGKAQATNSIEQTSFWLIKDQVEMFYPGAGHTKDNIVVWLPQQRILFGGCFVKSNSLGNLSDADLEAWPESARNLISRYGNAALVVPGHGEVGDVSLLENTLKLVLERLSSN